ncbi:beta-lactamase family protein [Nesterenkonia sp. MY13]|uniref:Beta-lactamase family protein n=1 Tax=Nesterenkonia sedimenti TaxID=1463632 RepID=A0A7X8YEG3_9MICC|nr:serine hydrolase domain-containing protein [Nesterenkonia sedimenti]NLS10465.1 beta-lactamase family protein [Nesterenkonia sedimenti]
MSAPSPYALDTRYWDDYLTEVARKYHVPGIVAGVLSLDSQTGSSQRLVSSTGVTSLRTGISTDPSTVCQIGSITKLVTATMIMQLRDEGKLGLESKVTDLLPELTLDPTHTDDISVWNLLTHTSGIDGDIFTDTGRGADAIERFVQRMRSVESLFRPSKGWSYCNSGFILAGRIIEVFDQRSWTESVRARITEPLGLGTFYTLPEEVLVNRYQVGHVRSPGQSAWSPVPIPDMQRGRGPAGVIVSNADDLLTFGEAFLRGGDTGGGENLLPPQTISEMLAPAWSLAPAPASVAAPHWGLGWMLNTWDGHKTAGHGGTKLGNKAWFEILPEDGLAMVVFCNGGIVPTAGDEICTAFAEAFTGAAPAGPSLPTGPATEAELAEKWLGTYSDAGTTLTVTKTAEGLQASIDQSRIRNNQDASKSTSSTVSPSPTPLLPAAGEAQFLTRSDHLSPWTSVAFTEVDDNPCAYVGIRCLPQREPSVG